MKRERSEVVRMVMGQNIEGEGKIEKKLISRD